MCAEMGLSSARPRIGIGSFAFRYNIGFAGFQPPSPMSVLGFLEEAYNLGYEGVQLCENLNYVDLGKEELLEVKKRAEELGLFIETGMKNITLDNVKRHLEIAEILSSKMLRIVVGENGVYPEENSVELRNRAVHILSSVLPQCISKGIRIGLENHFDLPTADLIQIIREINSPEIGLIFDTTNALGFTERPEETLEAIGAHLISIHLKDYNIRKVEAGYLITGTVLGEGRLNTKDILKKALQINPGLSIILEMTTRRDENYQLGEVIAWEKDVVKSSTEYLFKTVSQI